MNNLKKQESIEELSEGKRLCMRMLNYSTSPGCKRFWAETVNHVDRKIGNLLRIKRVKAKMKRLFLMVVLGSILFLAGCQTLKGVTGDTGWMLTKLSDNIKIETEK